MVECMNVFFVVIALLLAVFFGFLSALLRIRYLDKSFSLENWEKQCKKDFEKYGPVPDECYKTNKLCRYGCKGLCKES